jgi:ABC-type transport system involved in multi-copper enzyme maturation permease subunit
MTRGFRTVAGLLRHAWARHRMPLIPIALAIAVFQFLLTRLAPAPNEVNWIGGMLNMLPAEVRALIGNEVAITPGGFLALGYSHPFFILLMSTWVVRVTTAAIAGEVGTGTMDLLATRPAARWTFVVAGIKTVIIGLAVIVGAAWIGTAIGLRLRPIGVAPSSLLPLAAMAWLLFTAFGAVALLISASRRDGGSAIGWTTAVIAGSFVLDYVARLWTPAARLRPLSLFRYYEPQAIFASGAPASAIVVLLGTMVVALLAALAIFARRDL